MEQIIRAASLAAVGRRLRQSPQRGAPTAAQVQTLPMQKEPDASADAQLLQLQEQLASEAAAHAAELAAERERVNEQLVDALADAERRGLASGLEQAKASALAVVQERLHLMATLATALTQSRTRLMDEAEDALVEFVFGTVCRILGEQGTSRTGLAAQVHLQLASLRERAAVTVRVHPDDAELLMTDGQLPSTVRIAPDRSVDSGGCLIDSAAGTLDARLDTQMQQLRAALLIARAARRDEGPAE
jgi:flagellar assembly protein FliH